MGERNETQSKALPPQPNLKQRGGLGTFGDHIRENWPKLLS